MGKKRKIQDRDWRYSVLKGIVCSVVKASYRKIRFIGKERIPKDGAVIFAPNHTGALMDAMVIVAMKKGPTVFISRADIFKKPMLAKMFKFFKMMPVMRMRDGFDEVKKNNKAIETAAEVLTDRVPVCIFPEGTHQTKRSMLPLSKGIFRIALQAKSIMPDTPLYIVPVGIRYGSYFRFRSTVNVQIGNAINVGEFISQHAEKSPQEQINIMRKALDERMKENIFYIPNNEDYDATVEICAAASKEQRKLLKGKKGTDVMTEADNMTVKKVEEIRTTDGKLADRLIALGNEASRLRQEKRISQKSVAKRHTMSGNILRFLLLLVTLPYTVVASLCVLPITILSCTLLKKFKDRAFHNSVRFVLHLLLWPLLVIIYAAVAFALLPNCCALILTLAFLPSPSAAHDACRTARILVSDFKLWRCKELGAKYNEIRNIILKK